MNSTTPKTTTEHRKFPDDVILALHEADVTATCLPVQIDEKDWQAGFFYVMDPKAPCLKTATGEKNKTLQGPYAVGLDADLHEHEKGTMIELGFEIHTPIEPCKAIMLFLTGHTSVHFDALKLLSKQEAIPLFMGDEYCNILWQQWIPVNDAFRNGLTGLMDESVRRDALIRMSGHYDPDQVFADTLAQRKLV